LTLIGTDWFIHRYCISGLCCILSFKKKSSLQRVTDTFLNSPYFFVCNLHVSLTCMHYFKIYETYNCHIYKIIYISYTIALRSQEYFSTRENKTMTTSIKVIRTNVLLLVKLRHLVTELQLWPNWFLIRLRRKKTVVILSKKCVCTLYT
jgi:hypothetical protein